MASQNPDQPSSAAALQRRLTRRPVETSQETIGAALSALQARLLALSGDELQGKEATLDSLINRPHEAEATLSFYLFKTAADAERFRNRGRYHSPSSANLFMESYDDALDNELLSLIDRLVSQVSEKVDELGLMSSDVTAAASQASARGDTRLTSGGHVDPIVISDGYTVSQVPQIELPDIKIQGSSLTARLSHLYPVVRSGHSHSGGETKVVDKVAFAMTLQRYTGPTNHPRS